MTRLSQDTAPPPLPAVIPDHPFHLQGHELRLVTTGHAWFRCDGCMQLGNGPWHYQCENQACGFDLHTCCAGAPAAELQHRLFTAAGTSFTFHGNHPDVVGAGVIKPACCACGHPVLGFRYYSQKLDRYLHPCCASLPERVVQDGRAFASSATTCPAGAGCAGRSCTGLPAVPAGGGALRRVWSYRSLYDDGEAVYLHVPCLIHKHNSLTGRQSWQAGAPIVQGVLRSFPRRKKGLGNFFETASNITSAVADFSQIFSS